VNALLKFMLIRFAFCVFAFWGTTIGGLLGQDLAPGSMAGVHLTVAITAGTAPFATGGSYQLFTSAASTNYVVLGRAGTGFGSGTYNYDKTGTRSGVLTFLDSESGPGISMGLSFTSSVAGTLTLTGPSGSQNGTFVTTNYLVVSPPDLFLPGVTNGQFQSYLSGQDGFVYLIEASTNLASWSVWSNLTISDLTTDLNAATSGQARFFRVSVNSTVFAPDSLTNKTFNQTITDGVLLLPTNGICQWMADTNDNGYQILGGPGTTNSSGTYTYTKTGPNSGMISYSDSLAGNVNEQLVFTSPDSGYFYATNSSGVESGTFDMADGTVLFLGNVKFTPDTARSGSVYFPADGSSASLSVTNANGWIWTLSFPADALITPRTITMTPFASVDSSDAVLPVSAGVQLEPDGLQFCDGVTLTVTPPIPLGTNATLVMAGDDGSDLYFVQDTNQSGSYSTTLFHFTSAGVTDPSDQDWDNFLNSHLPQAEAAYQQAVSEAKALERPVVQPPEPPDYELKCDPSENSAADAQIDAYEQTLFAKEADAIRNLLGAARNLELLTGDTSVDDSAIGVARELVETAVFRKVNLLFANYSGDPKKMVAVTRTALSVLRQDELMGGSDSNGWLQKIQDWAVRVKAYYFNKLRNEHDYSMVTVLFQVERQLALLGVNTDNDNFFTDLANAMTFKLTMDIALDGTFPDGTGSAHIEAAGDVTVTADPNLIFPLSGSGTINYQPSYDGGATLVPGQSFTENPKVSNFDACETMTADIELDRFAADTETYTADGYDASVPSPLKASADVAFANYLGQDGLYSFPVALQNKNVQAVNQTFTVQGNDNGSVTLKLTLTHTPK
jgi:hypothetical protein